MVIGSEILSEKQMILIGILVVIFVVFAVLVNLLDNKSLNGIKAKKIGDGQHGTARWATKSEIKQTFIPLPFEPEKWRKGVALPTVQGTVQRFGQKDCCACRHGRCSYSYGRRRRRGKNSLLLVSKYRACLCKRNVLCQHRYKGRHSTKLWHYRKQALWLQCFCA